MKESMIDFEEYVRQCEPDKKEKSQNWQTAIGLQLVDGLKPSAYLIETAIQNIEGEITFDEVKKRIDVYYQAQANRQSEIDDRTEEADKVSARIAEILSEKTFSFSPVAFLNIHRRLFNGIYRFAGKIRDYNITKSEWVLDGETVLYADADNLRETLEFDFEQEKNFDYKGLNMQQVIEHLANFISNLWQIHIFGEGNTRTVAVFLIKYLHKLGFDDINNEHFAANSWYFRNALVRANYKNLKKGIYASNKYIILFFENILLGYNNILKNRELHIHFEPTTNVPVNVPVNVTEIKDLTITEKLVLDLLKKFPKITYVQMAEKINKNRKTIQRTIVSLKEKGFISRIGSDKSGSWKILINEDK